MNHDYTRPERDTSYPVELDIRHRVVHLAAGGWSFHALTDEGKVLVWGTLDSTYSEAGDDLGTSATVVKEPLALALPQRIKSLSVGRRHAILFDGRRNIYVLLQWGRPIRLNAPVLDGSWTGSTVVQVEAGWDSSGDSTSGPNTMRMYGRPTPPTKLPPIPNNLPALHQDALKPDAPPKLVQIAAGDKFVVGLTDGGHVLKLDLPTYDESELGRIITRGDLRWNYVRTLSLLFFASADRLSVHIQQLPKFCEVAHVRNEPGFRPQGQEQTPLEDLKVTHVGLVISAQFRTFVVYSTVGSSVVLLGDDHDNPRSPKIIPELQNRGVISVVLGDYHYCALTSNGELFSWGKYSNGALGLGSPRSSIDYTTPTQIHAPLLMPHTHHAQPRPQDAEVPTQVHFHHEDNVRDRYVFAVAASGWHCGALVIDLHSTSTSAEGKSNPAQEGELKQDPDDPSHTSMEGRGHNNDASRQQPIAPFPSRAEAERAAGTQVPQITVPIVRGRGAPFRIGYAARGAYAGRGAGRGFANASNPGSGAHPDRAEH
ncbi:rcc1 blip-ii [Rhizoctonia solani]|uniref:Rcc1 blip-ii n=1 Tax=Rhizoctonia solani TaxID=456999 RepID=A0A8H7LXC0_9AGAM|nr:rcc1 blip-ii [Rhizoctonia solani]